MRMNQPTPGGGPLVQYLCMYTTDQTPEGLMPEGTNFSRDVKCDTCII